MPNRNVEGDYRYAFQGQEKDPETGKEAFEHRLWDSRIGRWLSPDKAKQFHSPYLGMGNDPVKYRDMKGDSIFIYRDGMQFGKYSIDHLLDVVESTEIGHYMLGTFRNSKSRHLHISFADLQGIIVNDDNTKRKSANGVHISRNRKTWFKPGLLSVNNIETTYGLKTEINPLYLDGIKFRKGRNQIILLEFNSSNSERRQIQTLFHEVAAHAVPINSKNQHLNFSGDINGHFNPATLTAPYIPDSFPLNIFMDQLNYLNSPSNSKPPCGCPN